jgi:hypothetical protein
MKICVMAFVNVMRNLMAILVLGEQKRLLSDTMSMHHAFHFLPAVPVNRTKKLPAKPEDISSSLNSRGQVDLINMTA